MSSLRELWEQATAADQRVGDFVAAQEAAANEQPLVAVRHKMQDMLAAFRESAQTGISDGGSSPSGLTGGDALRMRDAAPHFLNGYAWRASFASDTDNSGANVCAKTCGSRFNSCGSA